MPDIFRLIASWRKHILLTILLAMIVATVIVFTLPQKYLASSTAVPANPITADKAVVFNDNIRELYSSLGDPSDLDMIVGTGQLDTIYIAAAQQFKLYDFYSTGNGSYNSILKAARVLKNDTKIMKTDFGELQVRVLCSDRELAPLLANALMDQLASIHQQLLNQHNRAIAKAIEKEYSVLYPNAGFLKEKAIVNNDQLSVRTAEDMLGQAPVYRKLKAEYELILSKETPAIHIIERARVSDRPYTPKRGLILIATALASGMFALWLAVILDKRQRSVA